MNRRMRQPKNGTTVTRKNIRSLSTYACGKNQTPHAFILYKERMQSAQGKTLLAAPALMISLLGTPVFAEEQQATPKSTKPSLDIACMQAAVAKRETAVAEAYTTLATAQANALKSRAGAINAAWQNTDASARKAAVRAAWTDFKKITLDARTAQKNARLELWKQFRTEAQTCKAPKSEQESQFQGSESQL